jgi:AGZA family xanthine/uracil permease-like MFS transporter
MLSAVREIEWDDATIGIPAFLTLTTIPLSYSIASGLAIGFIAYTLLKVLHGEYRKISWLVYVLTGLFLLRFAYLGSAG